MNWLRKLFHGKKCVLCHRHTSGMRKYMDDHGQLIYVCPMCSGYAERRAFRKLK
jgi:ribosome-binding protein aMBF1 (putative translation factor)